jgi:hypothetical protein
VGFLLAFFFLLASCSSDDRRPVDRIVITGECETGARSLYERGDCVIVSECVESHWVVKLQSGQCSARKDE